jgi:hypothetical protein
MDQPHDDGATTAGPIATALGSAGPGAAPAGAPAVSSLPVPPPSQPQDDDERFIVGLVLTYYRRHPQRARTRLLDLLGEVLVPAPSAPSPAPAQAPQAPGRPTARGPGSATPRTATAYDAHALWLASQTGIAPLKKKR